MIRSKQRKSLGIQTNSKASGGGCEIRTHAPVKANGFQGNVDNPVSEWRGSKIECLGFSVMDIFSNAFARLW